MARGPSRLCNSKLKDSPTYWMKFLHGVHHSVRVSQSKTLLASHTLSLKSWASYFPRSFSVFQTGTSALTFVPGCSLPASILAVLLDNTPQVLPEILVLGHFPGSCVNYLDSDTWWCLLYILYILKVSHWDSCEEYDLQAPVPHFYHTSHSQSVLGSSIPRL